MNKFKFLITLTIIFVSLVSCSHNANTARIMCYNVKICRGMDDNIDYDRTAKVIREVNAEVIALQELDSATKRSNYKITGQELADRLDMYFTFAPAIDFDGGKYGIGILSKQKPINYSSYKLPGEDEARAILLAEFKDYYLASTHLSLTNQERVESVKIITELLKSIKDKPIFVCGDFNATPDSEPISIMTKNFTILNDINDFTIPVDNPIKTIDYIFGSNNVFSYDIIKREVIQERMASDHLPFYVDIVINKL